MLHNKKTFIPLAVAVFVLAAYNFSGAAWSNAPSGAPKNNRLPVIHQGLNSSSNQSIAGGLTVDDLAVTSRAQATTEMRATRYCDENGANCSSSPAGGSGGADIGEFYSYHTSKDEGYRAAVPFAGVPLKNMCSCRRGDALTGCSGYQKSDKTTKAVESSHGDYCTVENTKQEPICSCLSNSSPKQMDIETEVFIAEYNALIWDPAFYSFIGGSASGMPRSDTHPTKARYNWKHGFAVPDNDGDASDKRALDTADRLCAFFMENGKAAPFTEVAEIGFWGSYMTWVDGNYTSGGQKTAWYWDGSSWKSRKHSVAASDYALLTCEGTKIHSRGKKWHYLYNHFPLIFQLYGSQVFEDIYGYDRSVDIECNKFWDKNGKKTDGSSCNYK